MKVVADSGNKSGSNAGQYRFFVCFRDSSLQGHFSAMTNLIRSHKGLMLTRKELEPFHGFTLVTCWITASDEASNWQEILEEETSLIFSTSASSFSYFVSGIAHFFTAIFGFFHFLRSSFILLSSFAPRFLSLSTKPVPARRFERV
jgi:hypothetical protein